jgi:hypothetical protein
MGRGSKTRIHLKIADPNLSLIQSLKDRLRITGRKTSHNRPKEKLSAIGASLIQTGLREAITGGETVSNPETIKKGNRVGIQLLRRAGPCRQNRKARLLM